MNALPLPTGVWRRGPSDWAYRVTRGGESIYGCGFATRQDASNARTVAKAELEKRVTRGGPQP